MAFIGLQVPHEAARLLSEVDISSYGEPEAAETFHITMLYLGKNVPIETIAKVIPAIYRITAKTRPFTVSTSHVTTFPSGPDGVPIICPVESNILHILRGAILLSCDEAGVEYKDNYPKYQPHVTRGYSKDPGISGLVNLEFPVVEWGAHELVLWGGDSGDNRVVVTFPFSLAMTKEALNRAYVQLSSNWSARIPTA